MSTNVRTSLSSHNKYYIPKEKRLELTHFCRQYPDWKKLRGKYENGSLMYAGQKQPYQFIIDGKNVRGSENIALIMAEISRKMEMVELAAKEAEESLYEYILDSATTGHSYNYLMVNRDIPCGKDMFYDRMHRFFYFLALKRD